MKGSISTAADFDFAERAGSYRGSYWSGALGAVELRNLRLGSFLHFEVPQLAVFDGTVSGETMEGTFRDEQGEGSFRLEKQLAWDDPRNAP
jgi:hypothetical protein